LHALVRSAARCCLAALVCAVLGLPARVGAQITDTAVTRIDLPFGRSLPIQTPVAIARASVANPEIADVVVIGERDVVINAKAAGETDVLLWGAGGTFRRHYRVSVHSAGDRQQILLGVKIAEVRKDFLRELSISGLYNSKDGSTRAGSNLFRSDAPLGDDGSVNIGSEARIFTILSDFGTKNILGFLETQEQRGNARLLAEPNLMAANKEEASFLAGGEIPIPIAQPGQAGGQAGITIQFREFGVRLNFLPEIVSPEIVKLRVRPEVSSLDFANAVLLSGFRIPALRTRRIESTVDVRRDQTLVISGLFNEERERVRTGIPFLMDIPILGNLFSSTRWQTTETELLVIVTPTVVDPLRPRPQDAPQLRPDPTLPAREALEKRLPPAPSAAPAPAPASPRRP
jgi:pilus assembly protein CpaC